MSENRVRSPEDITLTEIRSLINDRVAKYHPVANVGNLQEALESILWDFRESDWSDQDISDILLDVILPIYLEAVINSSKLKEHITDLWDYFTGGESDLLEGIHFQVNIDPSFGCDFLTSGKENNDN